MLILFLASKLGFIPIYVSPYSTIIGELEGYGSGSWSTNVAITLMISFLYVAYLLRHVQTPEVGLHLRRDGADPKSPWARPLHRRTWLTNKILKESENISSVITNPVFLKEIRTEFFGRPLFRRLVFWSSLATIACVAHITQQQSLEERAAWVLLTSTSIVTLLLPGIAGSAFPREIEQGNLDFLRGTFLSSREILSGKFFASLYSCAGIVAAALWGTLLTGLVYTPSQKTEFHENAGPWIGFVVITILIVNYIWTAAVVTFASAVSKRTVGALVLSYLGVLAPLVLWPAILVSVLARPPPLSFLMISHPLLAFEGALSGIFHGGKPQILAGYVLFYGAGTFLLWLLSRGYLETFRTRDL